MLLSKNLAPLRAAAIARVDAAAEAARLLYITPGSGQAMVYQQKKAEAEAMIANPEINPADVPHVAAEAAMNGVTLDGMAAVILATAQQWTTISVSIECARLSAKEAIRTAATPLEIDAAEATFSAALA